MNPAQRLLALYTTLIDMSDVNALVLRQAWANVFEIPQLDDAHENEHAVVECLQALTRELTAIRKSLRERGCTEDLLQPGFKRFADAASPSGIQRKWHDVRASTVTPEVRLSLAWAAWAMKDEEDLIDENALKALLADVESLEQSALADGVSAYMRELTLRQAKALRDALRLYKVKGLAAVTDVLQATTGTVVVAAPIISQELTEATPQTKTAYEKFTGLMMKLVAVAEKADKLNKGVEAAKNVYKTLHGVWESLPPLLPPP